MAQNIPITQGTVSNFRDDKGGAVNLLPYPVIGIVKDNIDPTHSGRIRVYVANYGGINPDDSGGWLTVNYMSPWFGTSVPGGDPTDSTDRSGWGKFVGNAHSYGMWMSAPDVGSTVICIFINGRPDQGYYIGGAPTIGLHHMVPALGGSPAVVPNTKEATTYGDVTMLPTVEANYSNPAVQKDRQPYYLPKPVHSYQAAILAQQGLIRDRVRGVISSSSQRETPSRVFGISTPGGPVYSGGYTNSTIREAAKTVDNSKLQQVGRTGGHSIVMDDGTLDGVDALMRLRTAGGHQIMMSDSGQTVFIIHGNGNAWIELGKEGTVDIFTNNSFNVRSVGDINLHADRDVNIHAGRDLKLFGRTVKTEADTDMTVRAGRNLTQQCMATWSFKAEGNMLLESNGIASFQAKGTTFVKGSLLFLNTGSGGAASPVSQMIKTQHVDSTYSNKVGWMYPSPNPLLSLVSRAPTHQPFAGANKGVQL